jgi:hypothetical protein
MNTRLKIFISMCLCIILVACGKNTDATNNGTPISKDTKTNNSIATNTASTQPLTFQEDESPIINPQETEIIPIAVNIMHEEDCDDEDELCPAKYKIKKEDENTICIETGSKFYNNYISGKRFYVSGEASERQIEQLYLSLDIINNTKKKLDICELSINVEESKLDTIPLVHIGTPWVHCNSICFCNHSAFNWKGFTFYYSILREGERFNGKYKKRKHIPYFTGEYILNLLPDLEEMGYNFSKVRAAVNEYENQKYGSNKIGDENWEDYFVDNDLYSYLMFCITKEDSLFDYFQQIFEPFSLKEEYIGVVYSGQAKLYGCLKFDYPKFKVDFTADIVLSASMIGGAASEICDSFDIKLRPSSKSYKLRYPYTTVIEPHGTEYVKLRFSSDKSCTYRFYIDAKNNNDVLIRSKDIRFHHYKPWFNQL